MSLEFWVVSTRVVKICDHFFCFCNGIWTFMCYLMPQWSLYINSNIQSITRRDKGFHAFSKSISPVVNVLAWLEFEFAYHDFTVQHFKHYAEETIWTRIGQVFRLQSYMDFSLTPDRSQMIIFFWNSQHSSSDTNILKHPVWYKIIRLVSKVCHSFMILFTRVNNMTFTLSPKSTILSLIDIMRRLRSCTQEKQFWNQSNVRVIFIFCHIWMCFLA